MSWKVGEVARRCGVSVRALHHYESLGLVVPWRTPAGHRVYAAEHLERLHRVLALRQLGLPLAEIGPALERPEGAPLPVIERQIARLDASIRQQQSLRRRLEGLAASLRSGQRIGGEQLLITMEEMTVIESYYTPEQLEELKQRREAMGPDGMQAAQQKWTDLYADVRAAIDGGVDPASPEARALADRWQALIDAFTGGDAGIAASLKSVWQNEGAKIEQTHQLDPEVPAWIAGVPRGD